MTPRPSPGIFRSIEPAWNDQNLRALAGDASSPLFFAHIRAAIGSAVQQTNCHPFRHGRWLFMHNGFIDGFAAIKRDLVLAVDRVAVSRDQGPKPTPRFCSTWRSASAWPMIRRRRSHVRSDSSRPAGKRGACSTRSRAPSPPPTGRACGRSATPPRVSHGHCSSAAISARSGSWLRTGRSCARRPTTPGWWSPSQWVTSPGLGRDARGQLRGNQQRRRPAPALHPQAAESPLRIRQRSQRDFGALHSIRALCHPSPFQACISTHSARPSSQPGCTKRIRCRVGLLAG